MNNKCGAAHIKFGFTLAEGATHVGMSPTKAKLAFTLPEVLITLGIIGVVAALTIPSLMSKYHRMTVETKLKKFYSTVNQAIKLSEEDNDGFPPLDSSTVKDNDNVELINDYYSKYIVKYMSGVTLNKVTSFGVKVLLSDGSGFTSYLQAQAINGAPTLWVMYCLNADEKYCKNNVYDGKNQFLFYIDTEKAHMETFGSDKGSCYNTNNELRYSCAGLIKQNGWKIPDDYPWIK